MRSRWSTPLIFTAVVAPILIAAGTVGAIASAVPRPAAPPRVSREPVRRQHAQDLHLHAEGTAAVRVRSHPGAVPPPS